MAARDDIVAFLDDLLDIGSFEDYGPNGLQVPGAAEVGAVATAVSASLELFRRAAEGGADLVLCHHGLFWNRQPRSLSEGMKERLRALIEADMSLAAYHLPLDAHAEVGNNALICDALGLERSEPFGDHGGQPIGCVGRAPEPTGLDELIERCRGAFDRDPLVLGAHPDEVASVGIVSGGGGGSLAEAAARGLDAFLTGEPEEPSMAEAAEAGVAFIAAGHYATETFGVRRLGELVADRFGVDHRFIDLPNPV